MRWLVCLPNPNSRYFTKITEIDPKNADAWIGKGIATGWLSTLSNPRIQEMLSLFSIALDLIPFENPRRKEYEKRITEIITQIVQNYYTLSYQHMKESLPSGYSAWGKFGNDVGLVLAGVDVVIFFNPRNTDALRLGIQAAKTLSEGENFQDYEGKSHTVRVSPENEARLLAKMQKYIEAMQLSQPSYRSPSIERKKDECFIATATLGDYSHPYVVLLRKFKNEHLLVSSTGVLVIRLYYRISPPIARIIEKSSVLRRLSLAMIIKPTVMLISHNRQIKRGIRII